VSLGIANLLCDSTILKLSSGTAPEPRKYPCRVCERSRRAPNCRGRPTCDLVFGSVHQAHNGWLRSRAAGAGNRPHAHRIGSGKGSVARCEHKSLDLSCKPSWLRDSGLRLSSRSTMAAKLHASLRLTWAAKRHRVALGRTPPWHRLPATNTRTCRWFHWARHPSMSARFPVATVATATRVISKWSKASYFEDRAPRQTGCLRQEKES
jgi:hypothetical protein